MTGPSGKPRFRRSLPARGVGFAMGEDYAILVLGKEVYWFCRKLCCQGTLSRLLLLIRSRNIWWCFSRIRTLLLFKRSHSTKNFSPRLLERHVLSLHAANL